MQHGCASSTLFFGDMSRAGYALGQRKVFQVWGEESMPDYCPLLLRVTDPSTCLSVFSVVRPGRE